MAGSHLAQAQLKAFSDCIHRIYGETAGDNPIPSILDAIEGMMRLNSLAVDQMKGEGHGRQRSLVRQSHVTSRGFDGFPWVSKTALLTAHDHPIIKHVLRHGGQPALKMSDFVTQRQLRDISLYAYNKKVHEWRDQAALVLPTADGSISIALNRDRVFTPEEFFILRLLQPHLQRVINRCALFKRLPGNDQLTPREREVLHWIALGKRDAEIAFLLKSSPRTVNKQVQAILAKMGAENRASAVAMVLSGSDGGR